MDVKVASTINDLQTALREMRSDPELRVMEEVAHGLLPSYMVVEGNQTTHAVPFLIVDVAIASGKVRAIAAYISEGIDAGWSGDEWLNRQPSEILADRSPTVEAPESAPVGVDPASGPAKADEQSGDSPPPEVGSDDHVRQREEQGREAMENPPNRHSGNIESAESLPGDHPDCPENVYAFDMGREMAAINRPRKPPMNWSDTGRIYWLEGYDHQKRGDVKRRDRLYVKYYPTTDDGSGA